MTTSFDLTVLPPAKTKVRRYLLALLLTGLAIYVFLPRVAAMGHAAYVIFNLRIPFVALSIAAQLLSYAGSGYLLRAVVKLADKPISILDGALMTAGANSMGTLGGGALGTAGMTYRWLRRRGVNAGAAGFAGWLTLFLNDIALAIVSLAGLLIIIHFKKSSSVVVAGFTLVLLILGTFLGALILCLVYREKLDPIAIAIARFFAKVRHKPVDPAKMETSVGHLLEGWDALLRGGWYGPGVGTVLNTSFDMLTLGFLFWAAGYRVGVAVLVAGYGIPQLLGKLTVILGGIGVVEATMVGLYALLGAPKASAVVVVLGYRLISFWIPTLVGIALIPYLEHRTGTR